VGNSLTISPKKLMNLSELLRQKQLLFQRTGGTHAAALFRDNQILTVSEDLGRHNAFDKAIGSCLLNRVSTKGTVAILSGRVSFEMVVKAARAGIEIIAAVSAPSSLALEAAQRCQITLCGFVRGSEATIYTHPQRVKAE
jgi:FdhD protein